MKNLKLSIVAILFVMTVLFTPSFAQSPDSDGDGVNDSEDLCPNDKGTRANKGCPEKTESTEQSKKSNDGNKSTGCLSGDCVNGVGKYRSQNGDIYEGSFVNKIREGKGTYIWTTGRKYIGSFKKGIMDGYGIFYYENDENYEGYFVQGLREGNGTFTFKNGSFHIGEFKNGKRNGNGKFYDKSSNILQEGIWKDDVFTGQNIPKSTDSALGDEFLDKVLTEPKPQVKTNQTAQELNPKNEGKELYDAVEVGNSALVSELIKKGINLNYRGKEETTLSMAVSKNNIALVRILLEAGANPNLTDTDIGATALIKAVRSELVEILKLLLKYKADPNLKMNNGWTALHTAAFFNKDNFLITYLIMAEANPNIYANDGKSPLGVAQTFGSQAVKDALFLASRKEVTEMPIKAVPKPIETAESESNSTQPKKTPTELEVRVDLQSDFLNKGYKFVAEGTTTLQDRNSNDKNQALKQDIFVGYEYIFIIVTNQEIKWVVTIGDDGKFTSSNKPQEGFSKQKVPNSDLTSYFFKFGFDDKSGFVYFIPHGDSWTDVRWVLMRKKQ